MGDAYFNAGGWNPRAEEQFRALLREPGLDAATRTHRCRRGGERTEAQTADASQVQALPDTDDENGADRLDLSMGWRVTERCGGSAPDCDGDAEGVSA